MSVTNAQRVAPISVEQFLAFLPPARFRDELIEGEIVLSPDPKANHQEIAYRLHRMLDDLLSDSYFVARERTNVELPGFDSMPSPDLFVMHSQRWLQAVRLSGYPQGAPQLVIEIVSPSNRRKQVLRKTKLYLQAGSLEVWVVYPKRRAVEIHHANQAAVTERRSLRLPASLPFGEIDLPSIFDFDSAS